MPEVSFRTRHLLARRPPCISRARLAARGAHDEYLYDGFELTEFEEKALPRQEEVRDEAAGSKEESQLNPWQDM